MTAFQKVIKYCATALALFLAVSIIGGIVGGLASLSGIFSGTDSSEVTVGEMKTYTPGENIRNIEIEITAAKLEIISGEAFTVESNLNNLTVKDSGSNLSIIDSNKNFNLNGQKTLLKITVPENTVFGKAEIITGVSDVYIETLSADTLYFEQGAGEVNIDSLVVNSKADIDGGAGNFTLDGGIIRNLDLDMGVGELNLTGELKGNCEFDMGVGEANINIIGSKDDYTFSLDKGIGKVTVDGTSFNESDAYGNGENLIDIDSGVGAVNISFKAAA